MTTAEARRIDPPGPGIVPLGAAADAPYDPVIAQLAREFEGRVGIGEVAACVQAVRREFGEPPITRFLPTLIGRAARTRLVDQTQSEGRGGEIPAA